jgi:oligoribonuclease
MARSKRDRLVWVDLEMTGLDPARHVIVEVASLVTEADLTVVAEGPELIVHATEEELAGMAPIVVKMHTDSGLLDSIRAATLTVAEAEEQTLAFVREHCPHANVHPLCGNSIGTDRRFIATYMQAFDEYLHYRCIDVSSIKELGRRWYPAEFAKAPPKAKGHRALADIRESLAELAYWRESMFRPKA